MSWVRRWGLTELNQHNYAVIGSGGFVQTLLNTLRQTNSRLPLTLLDANNPEHATNQADYLVLGTDTFQLEMMERWQPHLRAGQQFIDVSDIVLCAKFGLQSPAANYCSDDRGDVLFCGIGTAVSEAQWLYPVRQHLAAKGLGWHCVHPLDKCRSDLISQARAVIVWNGSQRIYSDFLRQCQLNSIPVTYAECGFFPQAEHFYFDKAGVNLGSQLRTDDLSWLTAQDIDVAQHYREQLFLERQSQDKGYVFVPLQIASDSNIQNHSRFVDGMQQYINFVLSKHDAKKVIFKVHPKDQYADRYEFYGAGVSSADTLDLIAGAALVRGINSSVLFEAALFGKQVKADGDCLLNNNSADALKVVQAMIARQYRTTEFEPEQAKLARFSNLGHLFYD